MSEYRKQIDTTEELGRWYDRKYTEMGDGWNTPADEINKHLDDLGVPFDSSKWLLDVGAGAGHFIAEAQKRVRCLGVELSQVGIDYAAKRGVKGISCISIEDWDELAMRYVVGLAEPRFDYIVSMGSLEHIVNLDQALDNIRKLLKPDGKFYFFCPNELWKHFDQPNERTMTDSEWMDLFAAHGLYVHTRKRWNDNTAFIGGLENTGTHKLPPQGNKLNIGSGQRRFDTGQGWINVDCVSRPGQIPDLLCDVGKEKLPYPDISMDYVVLHQVYEHFGLGEARGLIKECYRVLKVGGTLIITIPDLRALCQRWLTGQIDDYTFGVNLWGAFQGEEGDRHKWIPTAAILVGDLETAVMPEMWFRVRYLQTWVIPGADIARDWWILGMEATK